MSWTICSSGAAIRKAGTNANTTIVASGAALSDWSDEAEAMAVAHSGVDVITQWSSLSSTGRDVLMQYVSATIAQNIVMFDPNSYNAAEFTIIINILENQKAEAEAKIKDKKFVVDYLGGTV